MAYGSPSGYANPTTINDLIEKNNIDFTGFTNEQIQPIMARLKIAADAAENNPKRYRDYLDQALTKYNTAKRGRVDPVSGDNYNPIEAPQFLQKRAEEGLGLEAERDLFRQQALPFSRQATTQIRQARQSFASSGLKGGFQQEAVRQMEFEKENALTQLRTGVETQSEVARQDAIERLKNLDQFNTALRQQYTQFGEEQAFGLEQLRTQYDLQLQELRRREESEKGAVLGNLLGMGLNIGTTIATGGVL